MNLAECLIGLGYTPMQDFVCQDDGNGVYLKEWYHIDPQPTQEQLEQGLAKFQELQQASLFAEAQKQKVEQIRQLATERDQDISREEADEFTLFFNRFQITQKMPPIVQYPLVLAQIQEWIIGGHLPNDFLS